MQRDFRFAPTIVLIIRDPSTIPLVTQKPFRRKRKIGIFMKSGEEILNMKRLALFAFNGDPVCFVHVLLNALDMNEKGHVVKIIMEGSATQLVGTLTQADNPLNNHWQKVKEFNLVEGVCKACATKMGTLKHSESQGLTLLGDMSGHPSMSRFMDAGFEIITF